MSQVATRPCPRCSKALTTRALGKVQVDECPTCHGIWFDADELRKVKDAADHDLSWLDFELWKHKDRFRAAGRPENCPRCSKPLVVIQYDKTGVDVHCCSTCHGVWLDGGALPKIIAALEHELDTLTASAYLRETLKEAKEIVTGDESLASEWRDFLTVAHLLRLRFFVENPELRNLIVNAQRISPFR